MMFSYQNEKTTQIRIIKHGYWIRSDTIFKSNPHISCHELNVKLSDTEQARNCLKACQDHACGILYNSATLSQLDVSIRYQLAWLFHTENGKMRHIFILTSHLLYPYYCSID